MTPSQKKEIEEKFDKKFQVFDTSKPLAFFPEELPFSKRIIEHPEKLKSFLFSEVDQALAKQREELKKELVKRVEDMLKNPLLTQSGERAGTEAELDSLKRFLTP